MQTLRTISLLFLIAITSFYATSQDTDRRYWSVEVLEVKPSKSEAFEEVMKEIATDLARQNYPYSYFVCKSTENKYFTIKEAIKLADSENMAAATKSAWENMDKKLTKKHAKYVKNVESLIIKDLLERSFIPENPRMRWDDVVFARWEIHTVSQDKVKDYLDQMTHLQELKVNADHDDPAFVLTGVSGFDAPTFMTLQYGKDEADRKTQDQRLWEVIGEEGQRATEKVLSTIEEKRFIPFWILRDISYRTIDEEENL